MLGITPVYSWVGDYCGRVKTTYNEHFLPAIMRLNPVQRYWLMAVVGSTEFS